MIRAVYVALLFIATVATLYATLAFLAGTNIGFTAAALTTVICLGAAIGIDYMQQRNREDDTTE